MIRHGVGGNTCPVSIDETMKTMKKSVVVGGGVVGAACAYYLSQAGHEVTIVDRGRFGQGASHGNCGYVCPSHVLPLAAPGALTSTLKTMMQKNSPLRVSPGFLFANAGWFLKFAQKCNKKDMLAAAVGIQALLASSRQLYDDVITTEGIQCEWDPVGLLFVFHTLPVFEHYAEVDHLLREQFNTPADRFDAAALVELEPTLKREAVSGGYLYRGDAQLRPDRLMAEWKRILTARGVTIQESTEVTGFVERSGQAAAVKTVAGEIPADHVVVATGAWTPLLNKEIGASVPIIPGKGYSLTMPRPGRCPKYPMIFEEHRVAISPFQSGYRIGSTMEFVGYDTSIPEARLQLLRNGASLYLQDPLAEPIEEAWYGWRPMVHDGKPIIDFAPRYSNVLIAAGHGMLGLSMATGTGKLAAERITGAKPHIDPTQYALVR